MDRALAWFSCGAASAVTAKLAVEKYGFIAEVLYCDTFAFEHHDNRRFLSAVETWIKAPVAILQSDKYHDIYDVFESTRWLVGAKGARCTTELKKNVRKAYQRVDDLHLFGFTADEKHRVDRFRKENPELNAEFPLLDNGITKADCHRMIAAAGIEQPAMYKLGYKNNNCIGCVKGASGYWNKIRRDFPLVFQKMSRVERRLDATICKKEYVLDGKRHSKRVFLDELPPDAGRFEPEPDIECGVLCTTEETNDH